MTNDLSTVHPYDRDRRKRRARRRRRGRSALFACCLALAAAIAALLRSAPPLRAGPAAAQADSPPAAREDAPPAGGETDAPEDWALLLVNKWVSLPDEYEVELAQLPGGESVDQRICPALLEMFKDMEAEGIYAVAVSGYRTAEDQRCVLEERIAGYQDQGLTYEEALAEASVWVALPGASEHQTGLAVDINADGVHSAGYEVYDWLEENSWRYGFIQRYPAGKTEITGIGNEPWHYRYVGTAAAAEMKERDLCLEEYLEALGTEED